MLTLNGPLGVPLFVTITEPDPVVESSGVSALI
jgi:hypothetical protein